VASQLRVLVVEDDASLRRILELRLVMAGFEVTCAEDGLAGLDALDRVQPQVVVCDLMMPRLDGFGFCRQARLRPRYGRLPIILLTARERDGQIDNLLELGDIAYMAKPFEASELADTLRHLAQSATVV
jgi:OmpR family response regulator RpaB